MCHLVSNTKTAKYLKLTKKLWINEEKFSTLEEKRPDALEMAEKAHA